MSAYLELRKRQQTQSQPEMMQSQSPTEIFQSQTGTPSEPKPRKCRGKAKMDHVHTRREKRQIMVNALGQPISDDDKVLSELSHFLGTTVRQYVPLTITSWKKVHEKDALLDYVMDKYIIPDEGQLWVLRTMRDLWRVYKSRIKRNHYTAYKTDEERLKNRPKEIPTSEFKVLLKYWGDKKVQDIAKRNSNSRKELTETHTASPKSFAQIKNKMVLEKPVVDDEEPPAPPSVSQMYVKTRKRDENREYKLPADQIKTKIAEINKVLDAGGSVEDADRLVCAGTHSSSWLLGRHVQKRQWKEKLAAPTSVSNISEDRLAELTTKIDQLTNEMDQRVNQKVQESLALMLNKLAEKIPSLQVNVNDFLLEHPADNSSGSHNAHP